MKKAFLWVAVLFTITGLLAGCGSSEKSSSKEDKIVIGYFPNINHVPAMVAKDQGYFEKQLGDGTKVEYKTFAEGGSFMTALKTGDIDAGLVGPGPAMNNFSTGADVKIIAGASTGGTVVLAREGVKINSLEDFQGKTFITPGVGCTHDVQYETYLEEAGITSARIGGTMKHLTGNPAQYASMLKTGKVDIAVAPEPWAAVIEQETNAEVVIGWDEVSFGETLPASVLVATGDAVKTSPEKVQKIVDAHKDAVKFIEENPEEAKAITIKDIKEVTGQELEKEVVDRAWERIGFTYDVDAETIQEFADSSYTLKFLKDKPEFSELIAKNFIK
ncbi:aliphatic sulfonate ABC transporter substrate-binding protein [Cytobacillus firmus]|jgi:NitT/TauT family transport system substrate-binding protein|uniref:Aliphatic sulfonate ABC transporter substrate-binding protein n=1 Tax=Cytobacillus firmus TaxID=1399 RepID=A0AA46SIG9_CYTFI|nr:MULTISPECIES: aliphatic sulfonate ABC transporter substrate-binding protein [Bacillaceae]KML37235.1 ABC transporter substrate-binding protein [Cytobacillus firmus]MBG9446992.1 ABC transporter substrate-binding protein [Cytobacillus firmus]MBG9451636.1 ABC transporter substrate-binding protein [Cytobacillus firmus]MBG9587734.1 ABC transporter substrate-binding protein [Cytobacillus firmus]MBY6054212.1 aliphatic sulfonate ABC transporter substrate-binding protein [Cytobacillus firmus]